MWRISLVQRSYWITMVVYFVASNSDEVNVCTELKCKFVSLSDADWPKFLHCNILIMKYVAASLNVEFHMPTFLCYSSLWLKLLITQSLEMGSIRLNARYNVIGDNSDSKKEQIHFIKPMSWNTFWVEAFLSKSAILVNRPFGQASSLDVPWHSWPHSGSFFV